MNNEDSAKVFSEVFAKKVTVLSSQALLQHSSRVGHGDKAECEKERLLCMGEGQSQHIIKFQLNLATYLTRRIQNPLPGFSCVGLYISMISCQMTSL